MCIIYPIHSMQLVKKTLPRVDRYTQNRKRSGNTQKWQKFSISYPWRPKCLQEIHGKSKRGKLRDTNYCTHHIPCPTAGQKY